MENNLEMGYPVKDGTTTTTFAAGNDASGTGSGAGERKGFGGFVDSFKPAPSLGSGKSSGAATLDSADVQQADQLSQGLKSRHLQMIAIGGSIGTG